MLVERDDILRDRVRSNHLARDSSSYSLTTDNNTIADTYHSAKFDSELVNMATSTKNRNAKLGNVQESFYQGINLLANPIQMTQSLFVSKTETSVTQKTARIPWKS